MKDTIVHVLNLTIVLTLAWLTGCSMSHADKATLGLSTAALVVDWGQTRDAAEGGWRRGQEGNPLLGSAPSLRTVDGYFAASAALNAALWCVLPRGWRSVVPVGVIAIETPVIIDNRNRTMFLGFGSPADPSVVQQAMGRRR